MKKRRRRVHTSIWDRCVEDVRARGALRSPEAVCTKSLGKRSFLRARRDDPKHNPISLGRSLFTRRLRFAVYAHRGAMRLWLNRAGKLSKSKNARRTFKTGNEAMSAAQTHLARYPISRGYRFEIRLAY